MLNEGMDRLDRTSANAFANLQSATTQLSLAGSDADSAAQRLLDGSQQLASTLTLSDRPIVTRIFPTYITPGVRAPITIKINGINLDQPSKTTLSVAKSMLHEPVGILQRELQFQLSQKLREGSEKNGVLVPMRLDMTVPHSSWWRQLFGATETITYKFHALKLPSSLARVEVWYAETSSRREERNRTEEFRYNRGGRYNSRACRADPIRPFDGFKIDISSFSEVNRGGAYGSFRRKGTTPEGFVGESCARSGRRSGYQYTDVTWTEYKDVPVVGTKLKNNEMTLNWSEDLLISLPKNAVMPEIVIRVFDGRVFRVSNTRDAGFIRTVFDVNSNSFTLMPIAARYTIEQR
jgi:hypothetical protein